MDSPTATSSAPSFPTPARRDEAPAVEVQGVNHFYGQGELRKQVLFDNQLRLYPGEIVIMTGPSGSGKTTLLTLIGALRTVQEGGLKVRGEELRGRTSAELVEVRKGIGFIFQAHNLFGSLTAYQNVRMSLELNRFPSAEIHDRAVKILTRLGLDKRIYYKPQQLSGGQRQRVAIARALSSSPKLILADEPTAALDKQSGRDVVNLLQEIAQAEKSTILLVTHDNRILDVADRIVNMVDGRIISDVVVGETAEKCEFLRNCSLFAEITPSTLAEIADRTARETRAAGEEIVRQGDPGDKFYVIRRGSVEVEQESKGQKRIVATLKTGDFFGEAALIKEQPRNATVRALEELELYSLGKEDFKQVQDQSATFTEQLRKVLFVRQ